MDGNERNPRPEREWIKEERVRYDNIGSRIDGLKSDVVKKATSTDEINRSRDETAVNQALQERLWRSDDLAVSADRRVMRVGMG